MYIYRPNKLFRPKDLVKYITARMFVKSGDIYK